MAVLAYSDMKLCKGASSIFKTDTGPALVQVCLYSTHKTCCTLLTVVRMSVLYHMAGVA